MKMAISLSLRLCLKILLKKLFFQSINIDQSISFFFFLVTCSDRRAEVEYVNGTVKNCLYIPCTVGYFCEFSESQNGGQYICCGTNANNIYGSFF